MSNVYAKIGESSQQIGGIMPDGYIEMQATRPEEGEWIAQVDGMWGAVSMHELALNTQLTKREFLKLVLALTKQLPNSITLLAIESYVASASDDIRLEWDYATYVERNHPLLNDVAADFGITADMLDIIFVQKDELLYKIDNNLPLHE